MIRLSGKARIACKPADLSRFLADVANEPKWQKDLVHVQLVGGKPGEAGAKYERVQVVGGRNIKTVNELVEITEGKRVLFRAAGKVIHYTLEYALAGKGNETELEMKFDGEMLGFASMFEGVAAEELREAVPGNLERLTQTLAT